MLKSSEPHYPQILNMPICLVAKILLLTPKAIYSTLGWLTDVRGGGGRRLSYPMAMFPTGIKQSNTLPSYSALIPDVTLGWRQKVPVCCSTGNFCSGSSQTVLKTQL